MRSKLVILVPVPVYRTGTEYGIPVLMISESLISLSELIMHA